MQHIVYKDNLNTFNKDIKEIYNELETKLFNISSRKN